MECSLPPPLTVDQLSAALDGASDGLVRLHLEQCPFCASRLAAAGRVEASLTQHLHYFDCPPPERLVEYHLSMLNAEEQRSILRHVESCGRCREELVALSTFLADETAPTVTPVLAPQRRIRPRLGEVIARLLPPTAAPALRGTRGVQAETFAAEAGDTTIMLDAQWTLDGTLAIQGQLLCDDFERWNGALVEVHTSGAVRATAMVDDLSSFALALPQARIVDLTISSESGQRLFWPELDLSALAA